MITTDKKETTQSPGTNVEEFFAVHSSADESPISHRRTSEKDRGAAFPFLSWVQNKVCSHHTIGQIVSMLQLSVAHTIPLFWYRIAWSWELRNAMVLPSLEALKTQIDQVLGNLFQAGLALRETWGQSISSVPYEPVSFCDSFSIQPAVCVENV